jgi:hypothetical protein
MYRKSWFKRKLEQRLQAHRRRGCRVGIEELEPRCLLDGSGFSPISEIGNNMANQMLGTANTDLLRLSDAAYKPVANGGDGFNTPSMTYGAPTFVAGPRLVSNVVFNQADPNNPGQDLNTVDQNGLSDFGYTFGQFIDHDLDLTPDQGGQPQPPAPNINKDGNNGFPIPVDPTLPGDPIGSLAFSRSIFDPTTGITGPRQQINAVTSYLDLSQVYGSTDFIADALRAPTGGLLKTSPGNMLPFNSLDYFNQDQLNALNMANDAHLVQDSELYAAGDRRANESTELTSLQTLFMRNHNAIATQLQQLHPDWSNDQLYQEARKLNIAEYQTIIYTAYLPDLLGPTAMPAYTGYNAGVDPSIATEFSTVGFRFGHTMLNNSIPRDANDGSSLGEISLALSFFNPHLLNPSGVVDPFTGITSTDIGAILKGDADNNAQAVDTMAVSNIRNLLFGQGGPGEDLIARDIWRADDHGIGTYNQVRAYYNSLPAFSGLLPPITDDATHGFDQITSDPAVQQQLLQAFTGPTRQTFLANGKNAGDINPFVAGLAEDHVPGSDLGPLFQAILVDQFTRLRTGDRFFYLNESFTAEEQAILNQRNTLGKIIIANTTVTNLQSDVFRSLATEDGKNSVYYATRNGRAEVTGSQTGTTLSPGLYQALVTALANPNQPGYTVLVDGHGNYISASSLQSYSFVQQYLLNVFNLNVANKVSIQLLTTELNVQLGKVNANSSIFVPAITIPPGSGIAVGPVIQASLGAHGVSNPSGIANIGDILSAAIASLELAPNPDLSDLNTVGYDLALWGSLVAINNNEKIFILNP